MELSEDDDYEHTQIYNSWFFCSNAIFYCESDQLWAFISQSFWGKNTKFLFSLDWKFPEFFKTHPTFIFRPLPRPVMGILPLIPIFFGTPCNDPRTSCISCHIRCFVIHAFYVFRKKPNFFYQYDIFLLTKISELFVFSICFILAGNTASVLA